MKYIDLLEKRKKIMFEFNKHYTGRMETREGITIEGYFFEVTDDFPDSKLLFYSIKDNTMIITSSFFEKIYAQRTAKSVDMAKQMFNDYMNGEKIERNQI